MKLVKTCIFVFSLLLIGCSHTDKPLSTTEHALKGIFDADLSHDGHLAVISSINHHIALWDLQTQGVRYLWRHTQTVEEPNPVLLARFSTDDKYVVTAEKSAFIIWKVSTGESLGYWSTEKPIQDIALSDNAQTVLIGLQGGDIQHVDLTTGRRLEFYGHTETVNSVAISADGLFALSAGNDHKALYWRTDTGAIQYTWPHQNRIAQVALSANGHQAFTAGAQGQAFIWSLDDGHQISQLQFMQRYITITKARFNASGTRLLTGGAARDLQLWDVATGQSVQAWRVDSRSSMTPTGAIVYALAFSVDEKTIFSESSNGLGQQWAIR